LLGASPVPAHRIISLMPSLTEDLFAIGAGPLVVGVSDFTDYPAAAKSLPVVNSFSSVQTERVVKLHPDLVVGISSQYNLSADIAKTGIRTELMTDDSYADIFANLERLGSLSGRRAQADRLVRSLRAQAASLAQPNPRGPRCFVVLGVAPIFTVGNTSYIAKLIELVHDAYARYSAEALVAQQPDVLILDPMAGVLPVLDRAPWNGLRAVREHHVYVLPDPAILERPGPRFVAGLRWLIATMKKSHERA
jgi:iron complex transport system substrate-binding protein